jgi:hypothetical protein
MVSGFITSMKSCKISRVCIPLEVLVVLSSKVDGRCKIRRLSYYMHATDKEYSFASSMR